MCKGGNPAEFLKNSQRIPKLMVSPVKSLLQQQKDDKNDTHCILLVAARSLKMNSRVSSSLETLELY